MALSAFGMVASSALATLAVKGCGWCLPDAATAAKRPRMTPRYYATHIAPVGLAMALTLHFGNVVYLHLSVSFIQMLKAFTPIVTMAALAVAGLEKPRRALVGAVALIGVGTAVASYGEGHLSFLGLACMLLSEVFEATRLVMTQVGCVESEREWEESGTPLSLRNQTLCSSSHHTHTKPFPAPLLPFPHSHSPSSPASSSTPSRASCTSPPPALPGCWPGRPAWS
jgi:drug/metabolite transporter (DMT)-like permease